MKKQLFFCFLLWGGMSCSYTTQYSTNAGGVENSENEIRLPDLADDNLLALTGNFLFEGAPRYIPLETTAESRLDTIDKLVTHQSGYYLLDRSQRTLLHFDRRG